MSRPDYKPHFPCNDKSCYIVTDAPKYDGGDGIPAWNGLLLENEYAILLENGAVLLMEN